MSGGAHTIPRRKGTNKIWYIQIFGVKNEVWEWKKWCFGVILGQTLLFWRVFGQVLRTQECTSPIDLRYTSVISPWDIRYIALTSSDHFRGDKIGPCYAYAIVLLRLRYVDATKFVYSGGEASLLSVGDSATTRDRLPVCHGGKDFFYYRVCTFGRQHIVSCCRQ